MYNRDTIWGKLTTKYLGRNLYFFEETGSTNDDIRLRSGEAEGTTVVAALQSAGRGSKGRDWVSPKGNIYVSLLLKPKTFVEQTPAITLMAGLAVCDTLQQFGIPAGIKWPNDVLVQGKKICGILTEAAFSQEGVLDYAIPGIGINVNMMEFPPEVQQAATSMRLYTGREWDRAVVLAALLEQMEHRYERFREEGFSSIREDYKKRSCILGKQVDISGRETFFGRAVDITKTGALVVETQEGLKIVDSAEATLRERKELC